MKYSFKIRDKKLFGILDNVILPDIVYQNCKKKYNGPINKFNEYLWIIIFRYQLLGSNNHQLGVLPCILEKMKIDFNLSYECFASTINSILPFYCSVFYDVEKYFGSKGEFFNLEPISKEPIVLILHIKQILSIKELINCFYIWIKHYQIKRY